MTRTGARGISHGRAEATRTREISQGEAEAQGGPRPEGIREQLLAGMPVTESRLQLAGVSTAVLEGGAGPPVVLLHGPAEYAAQWRLVIPDLATTHRVIAPDLPGHGTSEVTEGAVDADRGLAWLGELIEATCGSPPAIVGHVLGGAIAARFASVRRGQLSRLVLVDALGLAPFRPTPEFARALGDFLGQPSAETHDALWSRCAFDLDGMRVRLGESWERLKAYNLDRARTPSLQPALHGLMEHFGMPAIPPADLARIAVPTTLIWGRHDLATDLQIAKAASTRYGWPLHVIEDAGADPALEQPEAFLRALRVALGSS
jgi:pimeloyl-ACP methyl ester carboxylesterase